MLHNLGQRALPYYWAGSIFGVAKAMFFPQISLTGSGGPAWGHQQVFGFSPPVPAGILYSYGASLTQSIFEGGNLRNNLRYAKSQYRQALISYEQAIQQAFSDVSDALIAKSENAPGPHAR
jgi:outer membrane protein, multidrug efflux system